MSADPTPKSVFEKLIGGCMSVLLAVIALYCAAQVLQSILPFLVVCIGVGAIVWTAYVVIQYRNKKY